MTTATLASQAPLMLLYPPGFSPGSLLAFYAAQPGFTVYPIRMPTALQPTLQQSKTVLDQMTTAFNWLRNSRGAVKVGCIGSSLSRWEKLD